MPTVPLSGPADRESIMSRTKKAVIVILAAIGLAAGAGAIAESGGGPGHAVAFYYRG